MRRTILPFALAVATTVTLAAPAEAACNQYGLACAYIDSIGYTVGSCHLYGTTGKYCYVTFYGRGSCNAVLTGSCTATLVSEVGGDSDFCLLTAPVDSCTTSTVSSTATVTFVRGSSEQVCGSLRVRVATTGATHEEMSGLRCVWIS